MKTALKMTNTALEASAVYNRMGLVKSSSAPRFRPDQEVSGSAPSSFEGRWLGRNMTATAAISATPAAADAGSEMSRIAITPPVMEPRTPAPSSRALRWPHTPTDASSASSPRESKM